MIKKALLDNKEYVNDEDYLMNYVNVVKKFTLISNTLDFKVNNIEVTDLTLNKSNVGTDENFVVGGTYKFNSSNVDRDNSLGLGLVLHAPDGSIYKDEELNSRLSEVEVKAGYYKDGEFVETEEFIGVTTNLSNDLLYITINCYKKNVMYDSYVQFSIDDLQADMKLHSLVLKELNVKMYSSELYDDYMSVVDATDKKKLKEELSINYYSSEKRWNRSR